MRASADDEWLEADGHGGFASGTAGGIRTRRYHALLLVATTPPTGRMVLVNGFDAWVTTSAGQFALSSQRYVPGVIQPDGVSRVERFEPDPWPRWEFSLADGTSVEQEIFVPRGTRAVVVRWSLPEPSGGVTLAVRPFLSGRDYHALHHENAHFRFEAAASEGRVEWRPYPGVPGIVARSNGSYVHQPVWYRDFEYEAERARGLDFTEDLASPGVFAWDLSVGEAVWILAPTGVADALARTGESAVETVGRWRAAEAPRRAGLPPLLRSAGAYLVHRNGGKTVVAGYPWFTDWGRDTFIAMRGLCVATGRLDDALDILLQWSSAVSAGMLPNRFPDTGEIPEYNAVDASLWFIVAVHDFLAAAGTRGWEIAPAELHALRAAIGEILDGYMQGARYGIRCDADGLLAAGEPGAALTWMDARVGDSAVTPRIGKPVEVQALWLNALRIGCEFSPNRLATFREGSRAFQARFWNQRDGCLHDVVDVDHRAGAVDASFRPNQVLAVGGLPFPLLTGERARGLIDAVEARLLTPMGLRTLAQDEPGYVSHYEGGARERDGAYHQGTVWPWLIGPFVEAWVRVRGNTAEAKREARTRFLTPLLQHLAEAGVGHISEIADGDPPHTPRGCPFQAWSLGEALRLDLAVLAN